MPTGQQWCDERSFIKAVAHNSDDAAITAAIVRMGKSLGLRVIAEGVETDKQIAFLRAPECDEAQGYFFSKPLTAAEMLERLRQEALRAPEKTRTVGAS